MGEEMDSNGFFAVKGLLPAQFSPSYQPSLLKARSLLQAPRRSGLDVPASLRKPVLSLLQTFGSQKSSRSWKVKQLPT